MNSQLIKQLYPGYLISALSPSGLCNGRTKSGKQDFSTPGLFDPNLKTFPPQEFVKLLKDFLYINTLKHLCNKCMCILFFLITIIQNVLLMKSKL